MRISFCRTSSKAAIAFLTSSKSLICRPSRLLCSDTNCVISSICCLYLLLMLCPNKSFHALISTLKASLNGSGKEKRKNGFECSQLPRMTLLTHEDEVQYNAITLFKDGGVETCYSFLTYGPQKRRKNITNMHNIEVNML